RYESCARHWPTEQEVLLNDFTIYTDGGGGDTVSNPSIKIRMKRELVYCAMASSCAYLSTIFLPTCLSLEKVYKWLEKVESDTLGEKGPRSHRSHRRPSKFYFVSIGAKLFLPQ